MKLNEGIFPVTLNGETIELKATLNAIRTLSRMHGGLGKITEGLLSMNIDTYVSVIRYGAGMNDAQARDLDQRVFSHGMASDLMVQLANFVAALANGGKAPNRDADELAEADAGNA